MSSEHIIKSYDEALKSLKTQILEMGALASRQLTTAIDAVIRRDSGLAAQVVGGDAELDRMEREVSALVLRTLALLQPMAVDLREIVAALKISADLERIGDYAANIGKRAIVLNQAPPIQPTLALARMSRLAEKQIANVLEAFDTRDTRKALIVWTQDEELDEMTSGLFRELITYMMEDPRSITPATHLLFLAKNIERIGDHVTNIAESVYFLVEGTYLAEAGPRFQKPSPSDTSAPKEA